eukprot:scaffold277948_cov19-Prasinocladus_malaysianus.AAC.1
MPLSRVRLTIPGNLGNGHCSASLKCIHCCYYGKNDACEQQQGTQWQSNRKSSLFIQWVISAVHALIMLARLTHFRLPWRSLLVLETMLNL